CEDVPARPRAQAVMLPIDIDLSPLLINRTAIFNLGRDIVAVLAQSGQFAVRHRFFGQLQPDWPDRARTRQLLRHLEDARAAAAEGRIRGWMPPVRRRLGGSGRSVLLDPLYVLFAPLSPADIVICLDLSTLTHPQWHDAIIASLYQEAFRRIIEIQPQLIMISRNTADTFYANFGAYRNRLTVVPLYVSRLIREAAGNRTGLPLRPASPYFLFVGSLETRKNVTGAIEAFGASGLVGEGFRLCIVGGRGHGAPEIERRARDTAGVVVYGYVSDVALCSLYEGAAGFIYPSYLEGFGVPLLEAMAFGLPCIATTAGASPEVGGPLVRYRDPDDHTGMAQDLRVIAQLAPEERGRLADALRQRAYAEFGFEQFSARLLSAVADGAARG
ncbi:MAG: glycosyltransferase family 4 protein, partial [Bryobacteraceae bacterium]